MSVTLTTLEAELQSRITALDGSESSTDLLILAKSITPVMSINRTNLDAKIQAKIDAVTGLSEIKDVMALAIAATVDPKSQVRSIQRLTLSGTGNAVISSVDMSKTVVNITSSYLGASQGGTGNYTGQIYARLINPATVEYNTDIGLGGVLSLYVEVIEYV